MKQEIKEVDINGILYVPKDSFTKMASKVDDLKLVLVRSYAAGVHFGYLKEEKFTDAGKVVILVKTRRIWYWKGANCLSQISAEGVNDPDGCKISMEIEENEIVNVIETLAISEKAATNLLKVKEWKQ